MRLTLDTSSINDYKTFLAIKSLPRYKFTGREAWFPDEYAGQLGIGVPSPVGSVAYNLAKAVKIRDAADQPMLAGMAG